MTEGALSEASNGAKWNLDPSFSVADALLADPEFAWVLKTILSDGDQAWEVEEPRAGKPRPEREEKKLDGAREANACSVLALAGSL
jgi:hypothetical protein